MTKSMWIAAAVLFLLFSACGFFMVMLQKDEELKNVHAFLTRNRLNAAVSFRDYSMSLTGVGALKDASLRLRALPDLANRVGKIDVAEYREKNGVASKLKITVKNASFRLTDIAAQTKKSDDAVVDALAAFDPAADVLNNPLYALLLAGCDRVSADAGIDYGYAPQTGVMTLDVSLSDACLGNWKASVRLKNVTDAKQGQLVLALKHMVTRGDPVLDLTRFLNGTFVSSLNVSFTGTEPFAGYKKYVDTLYMRRSADAADDRKIRRRIADWLSESNAHKQRNAETAKTISAFLNNPRKITFQSKAGKEVPLRVLTGSFLRRLTDLMLRLDTTVSVEQPASV